MVELARVVDGSDPGAPTPTKWRISALRALAEHVKSTSSMFARSGPKLLSPLEEKERQRRIEKLGAQFEKLAEAGPQGTVSYQQAEEVLSKLRDLGKHVPNSLVKDLAQAFACKGPANERR